ncbi:MAG: hypothetical protein BIFFINMI_00577 [Phycisphaerae bacterium]|nr:hypothetical protein [Phycisphaerae bacterium]
MMPSSTRDPALRDYYRRDQKGGVTAPDLAKDCTYAQHVVRARGKRTRFTSVTLAPDRCRDFGVATYHLLRPKVDDDGHRVVEHEALMKALRETARKETKDEKARAIQALRYARRRAEGLVDWRLDISRVERKNLIAFAEGKITGYFRAV